jgi:hypothetical protein
MQPVSAANTVSGVTKFTGLPEMTTGPYMVQTVLPGRHLQQGDRARIWRVP